jgi:hypothetical protein
MKTIGREIMWNLPPTAAIIMWALFAVVLLVLGWGFWSRIEAYRRGRTERENRLDDLKGRFADVFRLAFLQERVLHRKLGGLIHLCIYGSFIVLVVVTTLVAIEYDPASSSWTAVSTSPSSCSPRRSARCWPPGRPRPSCAGGSCARKGSRRKTTTTRSSSSSCSSP